MYTKTKEKYYYPLNPINRNNIKSKKNVSAFLFLANE